MRSDDIDASARAGDALELIPAATLWEYPDIGVPAFNAYYEPLAEAVRRYTDPACKC